MCSKKNCVLIGVVFQEQPCSNINCVPSANVFQDNCIPRTAVSQDNCIPWTVVLQEQLYSKISCVPRTAVFQEQQCSKNSCITRTAVKEQLRSMNNCVPRTVVLKNSCAPRTVVLKEQLCSKMCSSGRRQAVRDVFPRKQISSTYSDSTVQYIVQQVTKDSCALLTHTGV